MYNKFEGIREKLFSSFPHDNTINNVSLATIACGLQQFMEDHLGRASAKPWPMTKLPTKLFRDYKPNGPLFVILDTCYRFKVRLIHPAILFLTYTRAAQNAVERFQLHVEVEEGRPHEPADAH
jgi:hypothetical protein